MCTCIYITHQDCHHSWIQLIAACAPAHDLHTCPMFLDRSVTIVAAPLPPFRAFAVRLPLHPCPWCDLRGNFDHARVRRVIRAGRGWRLGNGPSDLFGPGVDCACCVVM
jgi:hypothetical protein